MKKYQIIYADPPWKFEKSITKTFSCKYPCMGYDDLKKLRVGSIADDNCAMFMWSTLRHLPEAIKLIVDWGFEYRTVAFIWVKTSQKGNINHRLGYWTLSNAEICLLGIKGHPRKQNNKIRSVYLLPREGHSKKPQKFREQIEILFGDVERIELFARQKTEGWDVWGNEVESDIEL